VLVAVSLKSRHAAAGGKMLGLHMPHVSNEGSSEEPIPSLAMSASFAEKHLEAMNRLLCCQFRWSLF
jgi:hypothetical protein